MSWVKVILQQLSESFKLDYSSNQITCIQFYYVLPKLKSLGNWVKELLIKDTPPPPLKKEIINVVIFRRFFAKLEAPNDRGHYLQELLNSFAKRFCQCNPHLGYSVGKRSHISEKADKFFNFSFDDLQKLYVTIKRLYLKDLKDLSFCSNIDAKSLN